MLPHSPPPRFGFEPGSLAPSRKRVVTVLVLLALTALMLLVPFLYSVGLMFQPGIHWWLIYALITAPIPILLLTRWLFAGFHVKTCKQAFPMLLLRCLSNGATPLKPFCLNTLKVADFQVLPHREICVKRGIFEKVRPGDRLILSGTLSKYGFRNRGETELIPHLESFR